MNPKLEALGLTLSSFVIENISLPEEVEKVLDKRTSMGIVGDLDRFGQYAASEAMLNASNQAGGAGAAMGAGIGAGMGMGMAMGGMQRGPWGAVPQQMAPQQAAPQQMTPPPLQSEIVWHIAVDGQAQGPYGRAHLGRLAQEGRFTRDTLVWTPGQDGWKPADEVTALAQLFTIAPPPPPPPLPKQDG